MSVQGVLQSQPFVPYDGSQPLLKTFALIHMIDDFQYSVVLILLQSSPHVFPQPTLKKIYEMALGGFN